MPDPRDLAPGTHRDLPREATSLTPHHGMPPRRSRAPDAGDGGLGRAVVALVAVSAVLAGLQF